MAGDIDIKTLICEVADNFGTPFFIFLEERIIDNYRLLVKMLSQISSLEVFYSLKTNYELGILQVIRNLRCGVEVSSQFELSLAIKSGFAPSGIVVDGVVKERQLLEHAIEIGVNTINVESMEELRIINELGNKLKQNVSVGIRCRFPFVLFDIRNILISYGMRIFRDFGIPLADVIKHAAAIKKLANINVNTIMVHSPMPFLHPRDFAKIVSFMFSASYELKRRGVNITRLNMGGGILPFSTGIKTLERLTEAVKYTYGKMAEKYQMRPCLVIEPGKAIVEDAGILIGKIMDKRRGWLIVDFSRSDYGISFPFKRNRYFFIPQKRDSSGKMAKYRIKANNLSPFDVAYTLSADVEVGDLVVMQDVGAYSLPFSYQFTRPRIPVYLLTTNGDLLLLRRKETFDDVIHTQVVEKIVC